MLTTALVAFLAGFGGLGSALFSFTHAAPAASPSSGPGPPAADVAAPRLTSATAQYGEKVDICAVDSNGEQHTIWISRDAEAAYLGEHPGAFAGSCGAFRPRGVPANVCLELARTRYAAEFVPAGQLIAYLLRNPRSYETYSGTCSRG